MHVTQKTDMCTRSHFLADSGLWNKIRGGMKRIVADRESDLIPGKALCSSLIRQFKGVDGDQ